MPDELFAKIPEWLKSLFHIENELRNAAQNGLVLQKEKALEHLAEARRGLESMSGAQNVPLPDDPGID